MSHSPQIRKPTIGIIGPGFMGSSIAKGIKSRKPQSTIHAFTNSFKEAQEISQIQSQNPTEKVYSEIHHNGITEWASECDFIIISANIEALKAIAIELKKAIHQNSKTIIMDIGSVKTFPMEVFVAAIPNNYIACHPIAGSNLTGFQNADPSLIPNAGQIIICDSLKKKATATTPSTSQAGIITPKNLVQSATSFWVEICGAKDGAISLLEASEHDKIYAHTSHIPHFVWMKMWKIFQNLNPSPWTKESLQDGLSPWRIASSSPAVWNGIWRHNPHISATYNRMLQKAKIDNKLSVENTAQYMLSLSSMLRDIPHEYLKYAGIGFRASINAATYTAHLPKNIGPNKSHSSDIIVPPQFAPLNPEEFTL